MDLQPVDSDHIAAIGYDEELAALRVKFHDETVYEYDDVSKQAFDGIMNSASKSHFFRANIKGRYKFVRIE